MLVLKVLSQVFGKLRIHALRWTQLSSERRELLEC